MKTVRILFAAFLILLLFAVSACAHMLPQLTATEPTLQQTQQTDPQPIEQSVTPTEPTELTETTEATAQSAPGTPLTEAELEWFNTEFFASASVDGQTPFNIHNKFLLPQYETPAQINLRELFYDGVSREIRPTQEEQSAFYATLNTEFHLDLFKIPRGDMERIFLENTGLTLEESQKIGMDSFTYLENYDAYYLMHGDTGYSLYKMESGYTTQDNCVVLQYKNTLRYPSDMWQVTLKSNGDSYWFVSNQPLS